MYYSWLHVGPTPETRMWALVFFLVFIAAINLYMFVLGPWWRGRKTKKSEIMGKDKKKQYYNIFMKIGIFVVGLVILIFGIIFYLLNWSFPIGGLTITKNIGFFISIIGLGFIIYSLVGD